MKNILFLCTGNSCRSQMAEGWGKALKGDKYNFFSAGTKKHGLNSNAVRVMAEQGIDISHHVSNTLDELGDIQLDIIFTVCSDAQENCPYLAGTNMIHVGFDDPPRLTKNLKNDDDIIQEYRKVRDEIKDFISNIEDYL